MTPTWPIKLALICGAAIVMTALGADLIAATAVGVILVWGCSR